MRFVLLLFLSWVGAQGALAAELAPWGVGPRVGTVVIPGHMPVRLPEVARNDLTAKGETAIAGVRGDVAFGADAVYYAADAWRLGLLADLDLGKGFSDAELLFHYDRSVASYQNLDVLAGGGVGVGSMRFRGAGDARLKIPYYPLRAEVGAISHLDWFAVQLGAFTQMSLPSNQYYTTRKGREVDAKGGVYLTMGVHLTAYFGDLAF